MKIKYEFTDGVVTEVEVEDSIGAMIIDSRRKEESAERKHRRHCYSMDAIDYEGAEYGSEDFAASLFDEEDRRERADRVKEAFSHLTEIQQRRLLLLAGGMSYHEIAKCEGKNVRAIFESIEAAKKKFKKFYR